MADRPRGHLPPLGRRPTGAAAIRGHLVAVDPARPGVALDYAVAGHVPRPRPADQAAAPGRGASPASTAASSTSPTPARPLGVGKDRERGFLHAAQYTWNNAFTSTATGDPDRAGDDAGPDRRAPPDRDHQRQLPAGPRGQGRHLHQRLGRDLRLLGHRRPEAPDVRMVVVADGGVVARSTRLTPASRSPAPSSSAAARAPTQLAQDAGRARATVTARHPGPGTPLAIGGETVLLREGRVAGRPTTSTSTRAPRSASTATPAGCCCSSSTAGRTSAAA